MKTIAIDGTPRSLSSPTGISSLHSLLQPGDIRWSGGRDGHVDVAITFRNTTDTPSSSVMARIDVAPFGAFVPGVPVAHVLVPRLQPGRAWTYRDKIPVAPATVDRGDRGATGRVVATASDDEPPRALRADQSLRSRQERARARALGAAPFLAEDREAVHWVGNINVFVGDESVERHMARGQAVVTGARNSLLFHIGGGPDAYRLELRGEARHWHCTMRTLSQFDPYHDRNTHPIEVGSWFEVEDLEHMMMHLTPPIDCTESSLAIDVTQRSTERVATVEFSFVARQVASSS